MRIEDAWVDDPLLRGERKLPKLCVQVDELPDETIEPLTFDDGWTTGKFGPFVKYSYQFPHDLMRRDEVDDSAYNIRFAGGYPPVLDIDLFFDPSDEDRFTTEYALPVTRARQLVKKNDSNWRLVLNDKAAQNGGMKWTCVETRPDCRFFLRDKKMCCKAPYYATVRSNDFDIPYCKDHYRSYNELHAARRVASSR